MKRVSPATLALVAALVAAGCQSGSGAKEIQVSVTDNGFEPSQIEVKRGENVTLVITRLSDATCATEVVFADRDIKKELPLNQAVTVNLGKVESGPVAFACGMDMIKGEVVVHD